MAMQACLLSGSGENNQIDQMQAMIGEQEGKRIQYMRAQDMEDELEEGCPSSRSLWNMPRLSNGLRFLCPS